MQVRPTIALPHITTGRSAKGDAGQHRQPHALLPGHQYSQTVQRSHIAIVPASAHLEMRRAEREYSQSLEKLLVRTIQMCVLQQARQIRVCDHFFGDRIASARIRCSYIENPAHEPKVARHLTLGRASPRGRSFSHL